MPSKGIDTYVYLSDSSFAVRIEPRGNTYKTFQEESHPLVGKMQYSSNEIDSSVLNLFEKSGRYTIFAVNNNNSVFSRYAEVNPYTGNLADNNLGDMLQTQSQIHEDYLVNYGFYDAGAGRKHQSYMYVTDNYANWMGRCLKEKPGLRNKPLNTFVLPGAHDAGMFCGIDSDDAARTLLKNLIREYSTPERLAIALASAAGGAVAFPWLMPAMTVLAAALFIAAETTSAIRRTLINLAYTQKDDITTQLNLGTRYFDFRPGYNAKFYRTDDTLRAQHGFIPGAEFPKFLTDVVTFLNDHPEEIVVVHVKFDGFLDRSTMIPTTQTLDNIISSSLASSGLARGGLADLETKTGDLIAGKKRLIILNADDPVKDSYSDNAYATDNPDTIIEQLETTLSNTDTNSKWAVLQLQGTYTNKLFQSKPDLLKALVTTSDAASPLLSTKAKFDYATYSWLMDKNVAQRGGSKLLVLLNDFIDNALTSHCWAMTKQRSEL